MMLPVPGSAQADSLGVLTAALRPEGNRYSSGNVQVQRAPETI